MNRLLLCVVAFPLLLAADKDKADPKKELAKLDGTWTMTSIEYNGKSFDKLANQLQFVIKDGKATVTGSKDVEKEYAKLTFTLDPSTTPKLLDMAVTAGVQKDSVMEGIYELKEDELRICAKVLGKDRPTKFEAPDGSSTCLLVLKREKK